MTVTSDALDMLAGDPPRYPHKPGDFHRHPETGAPYVNDPTETTKAGNPRRVMYGRPSNFGSPLDNPYSLIKWLDRCKLIGVALMDLDYEYVWANRENDKVLDGVVAKCKELAGGNLAADRGTHIHLLCEYHDRGTTWGTLLEDGERLGIPSELQCRIVEQWAAFRARLGVTALAVEQTVVNDRWRLAGTLDRLDVTSEPILTAYGILDGAFVGDIKTGGLTVGSDGQPNYWVKYPVQLAAYVDAVPYDTDTDERGDIIIPCQECDDSPDCGHSSVRTRPNPDIALIYHYDLARALAGEVVDWQAISVNVQAGREGGDLCRAAADFGKRRDLFAMPAPTKIADEEATLPPADSAHSDPTGVVWNPVDGTTESASSSAYIAVPVSPVTVEQPAVDPRPDTASPPVAASAADLRDMVPAWGRDKVRARVAGLVNGHGVRAEKLLRKFWPEGVPTLKHPGHTDEQLQQILFAVRRVEAEVGAGWHPDDGQEPRSAKAIRRALDAWAGRDPGTAWFAASLIATFEQCRNADSTFEDLVGQFSIEQADRLHDAAQAAQ